MLFSAFGRRLPSLRAWSVALLAATVGYAAVARCAAARGPLWLDEVLSLRLADQAGGPVAAIANLRSDNNHVLNTWYLQAVGPGRPPWVYRGLSIVSGIATVLVGSRIAARWGRAEKWLAATLLASSYLLIHYSSEARGYSPALCCGLLLWDSVWRDLERPAWNHLVASWVWSFLGLLAHPFFVQFLVALMGWAVAVLPGQLGSSWQAVRRGFLLFAVPVGLAGLWYTTVWSRLILEGGPPFAWSDILACTGSLALGGPDRGIGASLTAGLTLAVLWGGCVALRRDARQGGLLLLLLVLVPFVQLLATQPPFLFPRYFLVAVLAVPLAAAALIAAIGRRGVWGRVLAALLVVGWLAGQTRLTLQLAAVGRGQYPTALQQLAQETATPEITVSGDHHFGLGLLVGYYGPLVSPDRPIRYLDGNHWPADGPQWLILTRDPRSTAARPAPRFEVERQAYRLERRYDCAVLSGWEWWCYRKESGQENPAGKASYERTGTFR